MKGLQRIKALFNLAAAAILLGLTALSFRQGGFSDAFFLMLAVSLPTVPTLTLLFFRRTGTAPGCAALILLELLLIFTLRDTSAAVLVGALCLSVPLVLIVVWPRIRPIKPLVQVTLPAAGAIQLAGVICFCGLRFGQWSFAPIVERIPPRLLGMFDQMEALYSQVYSGEILNQFLQLLRLFREQVQAISFNLICMGLYALFGCYFFALYLADRRAGARWSGNWSALVPGRGISLLYMIGYVGTSLLADPYYQVATAVFCLFGFFYVFTAVRRLRIYLRGKGWHSLLIRLVCGVLLALSYLTVGGSLLSAYTVLLLAGWWFAASPVRRLKEK